MPRRTSFQSRFLAARGLALIAALIFGAATVTVSSTASAQSTPVTVCPDGGYVSSGQTCPSSTQGYTDCWAQGTAVIYGEACPAPPPQASTPAYTSCPDGSYVPPGQACPYNPGYTSCPNGNYSPVGQSCPYPYSTGYTGYTTCPNGNYVPSWQSCPSVTSGYCYGPYGSQPYCTSVAATVATVTYPAGWNIVAGPSGTTISGSPAPLFAFPPGASSYQTLPAGSSLQAGSGYWAYFTTSTSTTLAFGGSGTSTVYLAPGQFTLIGNPGDGAATVSGANVVVFTYSPTTGSYQQTNQLAAGQGGWAMSTTGGQVTITSSAGLPGGYPPGPPPPPPF